jgi:hypothetical protein
MLAARILRKGKQKALLLATDAEGYVRSIARYALHGGNGRDRRLPASCLAGPLPDWANGSQPLPLAVGEPARRQIVEAARDALAHRVDLLGSGPVDVSGPHPQWKPVRAPLVVQPDYRPIDWHRDFRSDQRWRMLAMPRRCLDHGMAGADVIWPWELSRAQHLPALALAARLLAVDDPPLAARCRDEFRDQVADWIANNPFELGVNWVSRMDAAIRAVSWVLAFFLFGETVAPEPWQRLFWSSLLMHVDVIERKLWAPGTNPGNHLTAEIAGLYIVSALCPFLPGSDRHRRMAKQELEKQVHLQFRPDGTQFENSAPYHVLVTEMFLYSGIIGDLVGDGFSATFRERVAQAVGVVGGLCSSRSELPQIGDDGNVCFIKTVPPERAARIGHILALNRQYGKGFTSPGVPEGLARLVLAQAADGPVRSSHFSVAEDESSRLEGINVFPDAGWAVIRKGPWQAVFCLGGKEPKRNGHAHEDWLSLTVYYDGRPILVDPGTYVYTPQPDIRNWFRYAPAHNSLQFPRPESQWLRAPVFAPINMPAAQWDTSREEGRLLVRAAAAQGEWKARRTVAIDDRGIYVSDELDGTRTAPVQLALCLSPGLSCRATAGNALAVEGPDANLVLETRGFSLTVGTDRYSASYGQISPTSWLTWRAEADRCAIRWSLSTEQPS